MIEQSHNLQAAINEAVKIAEKGRKEYVCPEHLLFTLSYQPPFMRALQAISVDLDQLRNQLLDYIHNLYSVPNGKSYELEASWMLNQIMSSAIQGAESSQVKVIDVPHVFNAMLSFDDCWATKLLVDASSKAKADLMIAIINEYKDEAMKANPLGKASQASDTQTETWRNYVKLMTEESASTYKIVGREEEKERIFQVMLRHDRHNPLLIGEPGVGKTALVRGIAGVIANAKSLPAKFLLYDMYELDVPAIISGAQFHGEVEKRLKCVLEHFVEMGHIIVYIDNIHNLVGAGRSGDSTMDATQVLLPYMDHPKICIIATTTYQEYNQHLAKQRSWMRRFQKIEVAEPSVEESINILNTLVPLYQKFHKVHYEKDVIPYIVEMSARHINDRFLPDKAIDLIDEAGAWRVMHPQTRMYHGEKKVKRKQVVDKQVVNTLLARICRINAEVLNAESNEQLQTLLSRIKSQIYGQDEAVEKVVTGVEMAKAGLLDEEKPMASLLFVGPTGVGKTEVARVLAKELGIELQRFDMSEYTEKHAVAKLIGSPAGYVGYEDGGLLTDAIRKTPNCVLLLDEIEKAHSNIYNILLQVMDYGHLTDNHGNKVDFRHVILIMTSNAGAQYASQASIGFGNSSTTGDAMIKEVRKTFKPEFLNRLSGTVVFRDMDEQMATLILDKKLRQLQAKLTARKVTLELTSTARKLLLDKGFTTRYGAREMDRVIQQMLSPLLMREILYGRLAKGGTAVVDDKDGELLIADVPET